MEVESESVMGARSPPARAVASSSAMSWSGEEGEGVGVGAVSGMAGGAGGYGAFAGYARAMCGRMARAAEEDRAATIAAFDPSRQPNPVLVAPNKLRQAADAAAAAALKKTLREVAASKP